MIFVTTGTQLPFPALVDAVAAMAKKLDERIIAQVGPDKTYRPGIDSFDHLDPDRYEAFFARARLVVAHAGIGTVLSAIKHQKPLVIMPRRFELGEHRNDHQNATARELEGRQGIYVARTEGEIASYLLRNDLVPPNQGSSPKSAQLIGYLQKYIESAA